MSHLSKRKIDPKIEKYVLDSLNEVVHTLHNYQDSEMFLSSLFSETERLMFAKRIVAAFLVKKGVGANEIADLLKLTEETVGRIKLWTQTRPEGFDLILKRLDSRNKKEAAKTVFYKILNYALKASAGHIPTPKIP